ncbi:hypothetical protein [Thermosphaera aggregans]|uniref:hypothetical protein n=1 Tax=Thermosphaera aggregans TaxID=54254 RepID=UPI003C768D63
MISHTSIILLDELRETSKDETINAFDLVVGLLRYGRGIYARTESRVGGLYR